MTSSLTRKIATLATSTALVFSVAACTEETGGSGSPKTSASGESEETTSESEETSSESEEPSGDALQDTDGDFEITIPDGFADATGANGVEQGSLAVVAEDGQATIVVIGAPSSGASLDEVAAAAKSSAESSTGVKAEDTDPPFDSVDGEEYVAYTFEGYEQDGETINSVQAITMHNDTAYSITLNVPASEDIDSAANAYLDLIDSWKWL